MPTDYDIEHGVKDLVHDYTTLVLTGEGIPRGVPEPWNGPVEQSFLVSIRKFVDFFMNRRKFPDDMIAEDYVGGSVSFSFPTWKGEEWEKFHNTHLFHLSYGRVRNTRPWDGYRENVLFFDEIQAAWRKFLVQPPRFNAEFDRCIKAREEQFEKIPNLSLALNFR